MREVKLGEIAEYQNGYAFKPIDWSNKGFPIIRIQNLNDPDKEYNYYSGNEVDKKYFVSTGDILIAWSASLGVYVWDRGNAWLNQHTFKVNFISQDIDKKFFVYAIENILKTIETKLHGSTMKHITKTKFLKLKIPLPSLEEQKAIVAKLDRAQRLIDIDKAMLAKYDQLIQSVFLDMFGDPVTNPKGWVISEIQDLALPAKNSIKAGPFGSSLKKEYYVEKGFKIYGQEQVIRDNFAYGDYYIDDNRYEILKNCALSSEDVLISLVGSYGYISIVPEEFEPGIINPRLMKISFDKSKILPQYFKQLFTNESFGKLIKEQTHGGTMGILNTTIVKKLVIQVPPIEIQKEFLTKISAIRTEVANTHKSYKRVESLFLSLIQEVFGCS